MAHSSFIVSAFDQELWCTILECRFLVDDIEALRAIIGPDADDDPELESSYILERHEIASLNERFGAGFELGQRPNPKLEIHLQREQVDQRTQFFQDVPYLIHTNFELPLMLDGRKKLARFTDVWPGAEEAFDKWVQQGVLHKEIIVRPAPEALKPYAIDPNQGDFRDVYYTLRGEEWRIRAMELLWETATTAGGGGWNEHHERLEGMLFGYERWQNDWWIETANREAGGIGGIPLCCPIDAAGLEWMKSAGYRALPPIGPEDFQVRNWERDDKKSMAAFLSEDDASVALARFKVSGEARREFFPVGRDRAGPYLLKRHQVPQINRHLVRQVDIVLTR